MTTFRKLMEEDDNGVALMSLNDGEITVKDASPFAVLSAEKLDIDKAALQAKNIDDELTPEEEEYVLRLQAAARSLSSGRAEFNNAVTYITGLRDKANTYYTTYRNNATTYYDARTSYKAYTDPDA